jgi:hypothetical protein
VTGKEDGVMTDQEKDLALEQPQHDVTSDDFVLEDARKLLPGEEIDPDSLRPVPPVDEDGEPIEPEIEDEVIRGDY